MNFSLRVFLIFLVAWGISSEALGQCTTDISGNFQPCNYTNTSFSDATYTLTNYQVGWTVNWTLPWGGGTIISGQGTRTIVVRWTGCPSGTNPCQFRISVAVSNGQGCTFDLQTMFPGGRPVWVDPAVWISHGVTGPDTACAGGCPQRYQSLENCVGITPYIVHWVHNGAIVAPGPTCLTNQNDRWLVWPNPGTYTIQVGYEMAACGTMTTKTVIVLPNPNANVQIQGPSFSCMGRTSTYSAFPVPGTTMAWGVTNGTILSGQGTNAVAVVANSHLPVTVQLAMTRGLCCVNLQKTTQIANVMITGPAVICPGDTATFSSNALSGFVKNWSVSGGTMVSPNGSDSVRIVPGGQTSLSVFLSCSDGVCTVQDTAVALTPSSNVNGITISGNPILCAPVADQDVLWNLGYAVMANGGTLQSTSFGGCATSQNVIGNSGFAKAYLLETNKRRTFGISHNPQNCPIVMNYSIVLRNNATLYVSQNNSLNLTGFLPYAVGDSIMIAVVGGQVKYYHNTTLIYSSAVAPTLPLKVCAYFDDPNGTLNNVETGTYPEFSANLPAPISSGSLHWEYNGQTFPYTGPTFTRLQPIVNGDSIRLVHTPNCIPSFSLYSNTLYPTTNTTTSSSVSITAVSNPFCEGSVLLPIWQRATLVSLSGNQVTHATYNNYDAGVSSYQKLPDGYRVESTVAETNTRRILGLSEVDANAQWSSIKYGILLTQLGNLEIRQSGSGNLIGTRTYATGDVIAIAHEGTQVKYYHNGVLIYTSLVPAPQPLLIDIWTTSVNATLQNVVIRRGMGVDVGPIRSFQATAVNGGSNPLFSWSLNGIPLPSTSNALSLQGLKNGDEIRCNLIPFEPCILGSQSAPITLALGSPANIALAAIPTICEGDTALLQILPGADSIVWPVQTGILPFSTDSAWLFADTNTTFPILAISPNGCATTVQAVHTVNPSLTPNGLSISPSIPHWCTYPQQQSVTWTTLSGWSQNAAQITSTGVGTQFRCAFAHQGIRSGNYVKTTILETNKVRSIGISDHWVPCTNETMAYEFALLANGTCQIKEKGINQGAAFGYLTGDVLELKLFANQLQYLRNGIVLRAAPLTANKLWYIAGKTQVASATLNQVVTGQFVVLNGSIAQQGQLLQMSWLHNGDSLGIHTQSIEYYDTLNNQDSIQFLGEGCGTALSPPFVIQTSDTSHTQVGITTIAAYNCNPKFFHLDYRNLVAVTQQGDDLYGTSYYSWGTSGFSSVQAIGDGYGLQFTAGAVQGTRLLGLSQVDADQNWTTIQYAWFLQSNGTLGIMESGVTMPYGSTYNGVDTLRILYQGGQMKYYKNSTLAYSHAVPTGMRLHADAAFSSYGRFYDVVFYRPSGAGYQGSTRLVASYSPAHVDSSFQWYCNGLQVPNELDDTLTLHSFLEGDYVFVLARPTDQCGIQAQSATVIGHVPNANPSISASPPSACGNDPIMLNGVGSAYFIWNGGSLVGVQGPSVTTTIGSSTYFIGSLSGNAGCNWSGNVYVTFRPPAVPNLGPDRTICSNSQLLNPGSGFQSYLWQNGSTTSTLVATSPGVYSVRVTNGFGCVGRDTVTLGFASLNLGPNRTVCAGQSVTLQPTNPWASYAWSNGANTASITVSNPGTYILAATHASGCVSRDTVVVTHHPSPAPPIISASGPIAFCQGGSVTLTSSPASSYVWSNGSTSQSISVSNSGNYTVTITDVNGCEANSNAFAVTVNPLPISPTIVANGSPTICSGDSVTLTSSPANSYAWSNGATSQSISVSNSGNYSVTISDVNGCMAASTGFVVSAHPAPSPPIISASGPIAFCQGDSVTLTSSQANSYVWSNGATSQSISVSNSGNYSVTISDANGCEANSNAFAVTVNPLPISPTIVANGSPVICTGDSVTLTSSHAASYSWSNGATSQSISVSNSGNYSVTISDVNGCEANSNAFAVTVNPLPISPTIAANGSPSICPGDSVTLTSSPASSYVWSNGATSQSISVFAAGTFAVTITDANGCLANSNGFAVTVSSGPAQPSITPNGSQNLCQGDTVTLISSPAAAYLWSNGAVTQSINVIAAGTYSVTTSAMNGCSAVSLGFVVSVNALPPSPTITPNGPTTFCQGDSVILNASPATSYLWSNGATSQAIAVFSGGVYTVTIFDANGCASSSIGVTVNVSPLPFPPIVVFDGLTLSTQAATTYQWYLNGLPISGANDSTFVPTQSGSYFVVVTDSNGCSIQSNVEFVNLLGSQSHWIAGHRVVPNPSVGKFKVLMEQVPLDAELRIYDVLGQMVYRSDNVTAQFDLSHLSKGSYFLQLIAPDVLWGTVLLLQ